MLKLGCLRYNIMGFFEFVHYLQYIIKDTFYFNNRLTYPFEF